MQITIIDVGQPNTHAAKNGRTYQSMEVTYKDEQGKVNNKKLMSFSNPSVFKTISGMNKGDSLNVKTEKDQNGYWQWTGINEGGESQVAQQSSAPSTSTRVTGSNYETKEERAARQVLIVKQSSLSTAVSALAVGAKSAPTASDVIAYAKQLEEYVMGKPQNFDEFVDDSAEVLIE
jgi:hypothetical protein